MRPPFAPTLVASLLLSVLPVAACSRGHVVAVTSPSPPPPPAEEHRADAIPLVIRRLVAEQKELVASSLAFAAELSDPRGRERALNDVNEIAAELTQLEAPLDLGETDSDRLDAIVAGLLRLETRVALLHEALRTATMRTTAVEAEPVAK